MAAGRRRLSLIRHTWSRLSNGVRASAPSIRSCGRFCSHNGVVYRGLHPLVAINASQAVLVQNRQPIARETWRCSVWRTQPLSLTVLGKGNDAWK